MIKKMKLFSILFSPIVLIPFNSSLISCGKKVTSLDTTTKVLTAANDEQKINSEIKDFIKSKMYPQGYESILEVNKFLADENFDKTVKSANIKEIIKDLDQLVTDLNNSENENTVELRNTIVMQELKNKIFENCNNAEQGLKDPNGDFSSEFQEVSGKILEVDEDSLIFNLKKFSINQLLDDVKDENLNFDSEQEIKIANSKNLKIYNFSIDLNITVNKGNGKKSLIPIKDLNLFVVLGQSQAQMLIEGITSYLQKKMEQDVTEIYLDGTFLGGKGDKKANEYLSSILTQPNSYDLTDKVNKDKIESYLGNVYLPGLIYKSYDQDTEKPIKVTGKYILEETMNLNFRYEGMEMSDELHQEMNFLKFFGDQQKQRQITKSTVEKITLESFLKDSIIYHEKYHILGSATFRVYGWTIRGFSINPIDINFKIYIRKEILKAEITNLQMCLNNLLDIMSKSKILKDDKEQFKFDGIDFKTENNDKNYTIDITSEQSSEVKEKFKNKNNKLFFDEILNTLYIEQAIINSKKNVESLNNDSFKFSTKDDNNLGFIFERTGSSQKYFSSSSSIIDSYRYEDININFVFNSSFKIKIGLKGLVRGKKVIGINDSTKFAHVAHTIKIK